MTRKYMPSIALPLTLVLIALAVFLVIDSRDGTPLAQAQQPADSELVASYDSNGNGIIDISELFDAIDDYFAGAIGISDLFDVVEFYFSGEQVKSGPPEPNPKVLMLMLINEARGEAGADPVVFGDNSAAQNHADESLATCISGHWGADGLKPYMRYTFEGGIQSSAENVSGLDYCIKPDDGYAPLTSLSQEVRNMMRGLLDSPGHRATILDPSHKKVNIGLAWDSYNVYGVQQFERDYIEFDQLPNLEGGKLSAKGRTTNEATTPRGIRMFAVHYDRPPAALTRGQRARTYCVPLGRTVALLRKPAPAGSYYSSDKWTVSDTGSCPDPYEIPDDSPPPESAEDAVVLWQQAKDLSDPSVVSTYEVEDVTASVWNISDTSFELEADLSKVLNIHGPGVYTLVIWGILDGKPLTISEFSMVYP